jgi:choice-of-anchor C domain-containing protein
MNKRRSLLGMTGAVVALVAFSGSAMAATLFTNGGFEAGDYVQDSTGYGYMTIDAGSTQPIDGWSVSGGEIDWIGKYWTASEGSKSIDLNGLEAGQISKSFATTANKSYVVSFKLAGNPDNADNEFGAPAVKTMTVEATGNTALPYSFNALGKSHDAMGWTDAAYSFVAKGSSTTITFKSTTPGVSGPAIDNVAVTETAGPGASCKNGGWKTMTDSAVAPFKNQGDCVSYYATGEKNLAN